MPKINPFNPNATVSSALFAGRAEQVDKVCKKLVQVGLGMPASFFVFGDRGIGKTALAKLILFLADHDDLYRLNLLTAYYTVEKGQAIEEVLEASLNRLTDKMDETLIGMLGKRLGEFFKNGKFTIGAFGYESKDPIEQGKSVMLKDRLVSALSNIIKGLGEVHASDEKKIGPEGVLFVIDEVGNLDDFSKAASVIRNIVTTLDVDSLGKVSFLLIGYEDTVTKFFAEDPSARRTFDLVRLETMPDEEAMEVLTKGFGAAGVTWNTDDLKKNIKLTGGYPHAIQVIGHALIEIDKDGHIDQEDWFEASLRAATDLIRKDFADLYSFGKKLTKNDEVLKQLASGNRPMTKAELKEVTNVTNVYQCIAALKERGAVRETDDGKIELHSQLFRTAILVDTAVRMVRT